MYHKCCKNALGVIKIRQEIYIRILKYNLNVIVIRMKVLKLDKEIDIFILKYRLNVIGIHMNVFKLDKKLTSVFINILTMLQECPWSQNLQLISPV